MINYVWLVPLLPLIGFLINGLGRKSLSKSVVGFVGCITVLAAFVLSFFIFLEVAAPGFSPVTVHLFNFLHVGNFIIPFDFLVDQLTVIFLLIITGVGFLIHLYSIGYMHDDNGYPRYFAYLNLFVFSMLLLVLGANYVILFMGWEGVGLCSYLLIGFWFSNNEFNNAAKKAFIMNRIGDLGFLIGIFLMISQFGSVTYHDIFSQAATYGMNSQVLVFITLLLLVGAVGKSAQIPLYTWLPDAMAGPTPVSALIHAATMVTAGIYMIARSNILYTLSPSTETVVAVIGAVTAVFAASIAIQQYDIKKVLAYSTVSQLGYMFLGLGVGAFTGAVFHVMTHAFFKALLFLGAGSVIHAMGGEQDIRKMGGLKSKMKTTYWTFLVACLAISGIPPLSGFFSKDEILGAAFKQSPVLYVVGLIGALMTAFYMFRLLYITFHGQFRGTDEQAHHVHESPTVMAGPLVVLAILSIIGGWVGIPEIFGGRHILGDFLAPVFAQSQTLATHYESTASTEWTLMILSTVLIIAVIFWVYSKFKNYKVKEEENTGVAAALEHKWYVDELYQAVIVAPLMAISNLFTKIEDFAIDGFVNGVGKTVKWGSRKARLFQTGQVGFYIFAMVLGMVVLFIISLIF